MEPVEKKLAEWKLIYDQLQTLRAKRDAAFNGRKSSSHELDELDADLGRLQRASDDALQALYKVIGPTRK